MRLLILLKLQFWRCNFGVLRKKKAQEEGKHEKWWQPCQKIKHFCKLFITLTVFRWSSRFVYYLNILLYIFFFSQEVWEAGHYWWVRTTKIIINLNHSFIPSWNGLLSHLIFLCIGVVLYIKLYLFSVIPYLNSMNLMLA